MRTYDESYDWTDYVLLPPLLAEDVAEVCNIREGETPRCSNCQQVMEEGYALDGHYYCHGCIQQELRPIIAEAESFAIAQCKLLKEPHRYEEEYRWAPTPEEYEGGCREAYTQCSVDARNRHDKTNYDELISGLDRWDQRDHIYYHAIRHQVEELINDSLEALGT